MLTNTPLIIRFHASDAGDLPDVRPSQVAAIVAGLEEVTYAVSQAVGTLVDARFVYAAPPRSGSLEILIAAKVELDLVDASDLSRLLDIADSGLSIAANLMNVVMMTLLLRNKSPIEKSNVSKDIFELAEQAEANRSVRASINSLYQKSHSPYAMSIDVSFDEFGPVKLHPSPIPSPPKFLVDAANNSSRGSVKSLTDPWGEPFDINFMGQKTKAVTTVANIENPKTGTRQASMTRSKCLVIWQSKVPIPEKGTLSVEARLLGPSDIMDIQIPDQSADGLQITHLIEVMRAEKVEWG